MTDAHARVAFRGRTVDAATKAALEQMETILGYELTVVQGSFNTGVSASAGTHNMGRVVDLAPYDWKRKVAAARKVGFAAWHRLPSQGPWGEHIHMCLILNDFDNRDGIAPLAYSQITDYIHGRNGLASHGSDTDWRPVPLQAFRYPPKEPVVPPFHNNVTEARDALVTAAHALGVAASKLEATPGSRRVTQAQALAVRACRRSVNGILNILPKK